MQRNFIVFLLGFFFSSLVWPHGPTPQKANESIKIQASVDAVWEIVKKFEKIGDWHPDLKGSEGDGKKEEPRVRTLTFQNGEQLHEEMDFYSNNDHEYGYRLKQENTKALPVSSYTIKVQVTPDGDNASLVAMKGRFYRGDTGNTPAENMNDEAAVKAMQGFLQHGLEGLKKKAEGH